jgi:hypothetical protein
MGLRVGPESWVAVISLKPTTGLRRYLPKRMVDLYSNLIGGRGHEGSE